MEAGGEFENSTSGTPISAELVIPFPTKDLATVAFNSLRVDKEPKRSLTKKSLLVEDNNLKVHFTAQETRHLRTSINSFLDFLLVAVKAIEEFAPPNFQI